MAKVQKLGYSALERNFDEFFSETYVNTGSYSFAAGTLASLLKQILVDMPAAKQQYYLDQLRGVQANSSRSYFTS